MSADAVFAALADPTRRHVVERLAGGGALTATSLARELPITRQAVAKHLASLRAAELVSSERAGRETRYRFEPRPLAEAAGWIARVGGEWDERLGALERLLATRR
jgi:ArsR family transcriptional regulator, cadmium/lead-responsive transcriptional repressor